MLMNKTHLVFIVLVLALLSACSNPNFHRERLEGLLGTNDFSELKGLTTGFNDTFHHYRFVTDQRVIDAVVKRYALGDDESFDTSELRTFALIPFFDNREVKWWRPQEIAGGQVYYRWFERDENREGPVGPYFYELGFNPDTGVSYLVEGYP